jgi:hypothetical protein
MAQDDRDKQLPIWLNIRNRKTRDIKPDPENRPQSEMRKFSSGSLWASTVLGGLVSFFLLQSALRYHLPGGNTLLPESRIPLP